MTRTYETHRTTTVTTEPGAPKRRGRPPNSTGGRVQIFASEGRVLIDANVPLDLALRMLEPAINAGVIIHQ